MEITRVQLFNQVWETPMIHLAKKLNLSDVGLRKICTKHGIPLPKSGYWTRKELGKTDPRPELPFPNHNPNIDLPNEAQAKKNKSLGETIKLGNSQLDDIQHRTIDQLHDLRCIRTLQHIKEHIKKIEKKTGQSFDSIKNQPSKWPPTNLFTFEYFHSREEEVPIVATAKNAIRALCITDEIIERLDRLGIPVNFEPRRNYVRYEMFAEKQEERIEFEFRETWTKATPTPSLKRLFHLAEGRGIWRDYIEVPKNVLCVQLGGTYGRIFNDTRVKLEYQIDKIVDYIVTKLDRKIQWRIEERLQRIESERKRAIYKYNQQIETDQNNQLKLAIEESQRLLDLQQLREYLCAVEAAVNNLPSDKQAIGHEWIKLVRSLVDLKNPITKRLKKFKSLLEDGANGSVQFWNEALLPDDYVFPDQEDPL